MRLVWYTKKRKTNIKNQEAKVSLPGSFATVDDSFIENINFVPEKI